MNGHAGHQRMVRTVVCGVLPAALLAALVVVPAAAWSRLPGRVADHWTLSGTANGAAPRLVPFLILGGLAVAGVAILWGGVAAVRHGPGGPGPRGSLPGAGVMMTGLFMIAIATASCVLVAVANAGVSDWREASVGAGGVLGIAGGSAVLTAAAGYLLRRSGGLGAVDDGSPRPSLGLRANERAIWTGRARARWPGLAGTALLAGGALTGLAGLWEVTVVMVAGGAVMFAFTSVRVTVAARGVTVAYGPLGLRLTRIPLRRIARAEAVSQTAFNFGYRGSLAVFGSALVALRRGPALSLILRDGKAFTVTVDDAATGAALLNDLIAGSRELAGG
jgi:Protein of unknown function (DUF1648)